MATLGNTKTFLLQNTEIIMPKNIDDVMKEIIKNHREIKDRDNKISSDLNSMKKTLKSLDKTVSEILSKIQEFEIIMDAAAILEDEEEDDYETEWTPYEDQKNEDYEDYDEDIDHEEPL